MSNLDLAFNKPCVFISYAKEDRRKALEIYRRFHQANLRPWMDEHGLKPGDEWARTIPRIIRNSRFFLVLLSSRAATKRGFLQKEISLALDVAEEIPDGQVFIIPARIEECEVPERLSEWHWSDIYKRGGVARLQASIIDLLGSDYEGPLPLPQPTPKASSWYEPMMHELCRVTGEVWYRKVDRAKCLVSNRHFLVFLSKIPSCIQRDRKILKREITQEQLNFVIPKTYEYLIEQGRVVEVVAPKSELRWLRLKSRNAVAHIDARYWGLIEGMVPGAVAYLAESGRKICFHVGGELRAVVMAMRVD